MNRCYPLDAAIVVTALVLGLFAHQTVQGQATCTTDQCEEVNCWQIESGTEEDDYNCRRTRVTQSGSYTICSLPEWTDLWVPEDPFADPMNCWTPGASAPDVDIEDVKDCDPDCDNTPNRASLCGTDPRPWGWVDDTNCVAPSSN